MKRLLAITALTVLGLALATPASAGHHGFRGGHARVVVGGFATRSVIVRHPVFYRPRAFFSFGFGYPAYSYPAPAYYGPPVVYEPPPYTVWVPGYYAWDDGFRVWIGGHWSR